MLVKRLENCYEFESMTKDGAFMVSLTLTDDGKESLYTIPLGVKVNYEPLALKSGSIKKIIGKTRWNNFQRMKELGITTMFIDRHSKE